jgi:hypothetical protein
MGWEMSSAVISLVIAVVGVCGTLASAIFTQQLSQRARLRELEHTERLRLSEQETAEKQRKTDQLRSCYVQLNANDRNYRDAMLAYAYALKAGSPGEAEAGDVATARRAQRDARAEAQMIVSEEVLDTEGRVNARLTMAYRRLQQIQRESDASVREALLEEVIKLLDGIISLLSRARVTMRMDLGVIDEPPAWYQLEPGATQGRLAHAHCRVLSSEKQTLTSPELLYLGIDAGSETVA